MLLSILSVFITSKCINQLCKYSPDKKRNVHKHLSQLVNNYYYNRKLLLNFCTKMIGHLT